MSTIREAVSIDLQLRCVSFAQKCRIMVIFYVSGYNDIRNVCCSVNLVLQKLKMQDRISFDGMSCSIEN